MSFDAAIRVFFGGDTTGLRTSVKEADGIINRFSAGVKGIAIGIGAGAVIGFFKQIVDNAGAIQDFSDRVGVSSTSIQSLNFAIKQSGGTIQDAAKIWDSARGNLDALAAGNEDAANTFHKLGLAQKDLIGLPLDKQIEKIAAAYVRVKGDAGAYSAVTDILGTKSAKLIAVMEDLGSNGFDRITEAATKSGQVISERTIKQLDELGDRLVMVKGIAVTVGSELAAIGMKLAEVLVRGAPATIIQTIAEKFGLVAPAAEKAAAAIATVTAKIETHLATQKDILAASQNDFKRDLEYLDRKGMTLEKIALMQERVGALAREALKYDKESKEYLDLMQKAKAMLADSDKERLKYETAGRVEIEKQVEVAGILGKTKGLITEADRVAAADKARSLALEYQNVEGISEQEQANLKIYALQSAEKRNQRDIQNALSSGLENLSDDELKNLGIKLEENKAYQKQLDILFKIIAAILGKADAEARATAELEKQKRIQGELAKLNKKIGDDFMAQLSMGGLTKAQAQDASDETLREVIRRNEQELQTLRQNPGSAFSFGNSLTITQRENANRTAQAELQFRDSLRFDVGFGGNEGARRNFDGNPLAFEGLISKYVTGQTDLQKTNDILEKIDGKLEGKFRNA